MVIISNRNNKIESVFEMRNSTDCLSLTGYGSEAVLEFFDTGD